MTTMQLEHRPIEGSDFMHPQWCGGCDACGPAPTICLACSYGESGGPLGRPTAWPCAHVDQCPGCIGRGTHDVCRICDQPIPEHLRYRPDMPGPQDNPALDGWAFNLALEAIDRMKEAAL